jgi:hypothetical protein
MSSLQSAVRPSFTVVQSSHLYQEPQMGVLILIH